MGVRKDKKSGGRVEKSKKRDVNGERNRADKKECKKERSDEKADESEEEKKKT